MSTLVLLFALSVKPDQARAPVVKAKAAVVCVAKKVKPDQVGNRKHHLFPIFKHHRNVR
jgi:hypothetical protein